MKDKQINILYWIAMALLLGYFAYIRGWILTDFKSLTPKEIATLIQKEEHNISLLDVRTLLEFDREHIENAEVIPLNLLLDSLNKLENIKNKKIIVYCHSGSRSIKASRILKSQGFTPINMQGGLIEYKKAGFEVIRVVK